MDRENLRFFGNGRPAHQRVCKLPIQILWHRKRFAQQVIALNKAHHDLQPSVVALK